jgi:hypothetical protein
MTASKKMYFDFANYENIRIDLQIIWLQKNSFQWNLDSGFNVETLFKMATREFNPVNSISFIWNDNMREKREANANATWRALIRDRPRGDGV